MLRPTIRVDLLPGSFLLIVSSLTSPTLGSVRKMLLQRLESYEDTISARLMRAKAEGDLSEKNLLHPLRDP